NILRFFNGSERGQGQRLGLATLKNGGTMRARQDSDFAGYLAQILISATVHSLLLFENAATKRRLLDVIERLRDRKLVGLGMFLDDRLFYFFVECIDCFGSRHFALGIKRAFDAIARNLVGNFQQFLISLKQWHFTLWFGD